MCCLRIVGAHFVAKMQNIQSSLPNRWLKKEAASVKFYKSPWRKKPYPGLQILTIEELLNGKEIDSPPLVQVNITFKKAPKAKVKKEPHPELEYPQD